MTIIGDLASPFCSDCRGVLFVFGPPRRRCGSGAARNDQVGTIAWKMATPSDLLAFTAAEGSPPARAVWELFALTIQPRTTL